MSNSTLVNCRVASPNRNSPRNHKIDTITPHCIVGQLDAETIGACFTSSSAKASCNYGIGLDGRIVLVVDEKDRSWCSSSSSNDNRAVTIECASDKEHPYAMKGVVYETLIKLCVDICQRNGINKLLWLGSKEKTLAYMPKSGEAVLTAHRWFRNKACPGDWLYSRYGDLAEKVTARLSGNTNPQPSSGSTIYRVQIGAYEKKANADAQLSKVKAAGFDAFVVKADGLYKVQVGAYEKKSNADAQLDRVKASCFDAFITVG